MEQFLRHDLGLVTSDNPPAQFGVLLEARQAITEIVSPGDIPSLPAPNISPEFLGFAIADPDGADRQSTANAMMLDLAERVLHLDGPQDRMSGLVSR